MFLLSQVNGLDVPTAAVRQTLRDLDQSVEQSVRIERIRQLEKLRSVVAAAQARETAAFVAEERMRQRAAGVPAGRVGRGVAAQVGLARRMSPHAAARYVGQVVIMTRSCRRRLNASGPGR